MRNTTLQRKTPMGRRREGRTHGLGHKVAEALGLVRRAEPKAPTVFRSKAHCANVRALPCVNCGLAKHSQAAHLNLLVAAKGLGLKASDAFVVPLCGPRFAVRGCHAELDQGNAYDKATREALQIKWLQETRTTLRDLGQWPDAAEADLERFLGDYLRGTR